MHVFRITFNGVKLDLALTEQGDGSSNSQRPGLAYTHITLHLYTAQSELITDQRQCLIWSAGLILISL